MVLQLQPERARARPRLLPVIFGPRFFRVALVGFVILTIYALFVGALFWKGGDTAQAVQPYNTHH